MTSDGKQGRPLHEEVADRIHMLAAEVWASTAYEPEVARQDWDDCIVHLKKAIDALARIPFRK